VQQNLSGIENKGQNSRMSFSTIPRREPPLVIFLNVGKYDGFQMKCPCCGEVMEQREKNGKVTKFQCKGCGLTDTQIVAGNYNSN
jgi:hypothetical protein